MPKTSQLVTVRIRDLRLSRGWSQEVLAEEANLSRDAISRIERGARGPRLDTLEMLADAFGLSLSKLLDFNKPPPHRSKGQKDRARAIERSLALVDDWLADALIDVVRVITQAYVRAHTRGDLKQTATGTLRAHRSGGARSSGTKSIRGKSRRRPPDGFTPH